MPVKDTEKFLPACLDSILMQTEQHWELLVVDDGSKDESWNILQTYSKKDARIKPLKNNGKGIIEALRTAYHHASGILITRMDSDDKMSLDKLDLMSRQLVLQGEGNIIVGLVEYFSENNLGEGYLKYANWLNELTKDGNNFSEIYKECVIPSPCWMIWKNDMEKCGAFDADIYPEDYDLCFRFYEHELKIIPILKTLHYWRDYEERTSRNNPNYLDNRFTDLKINYFIKIDYKKEKQLFLWGAGKKGKNIAKKLIEKNISFKWICDNDKKIGKDIYGVTLEHFNSALIDENIQIINSVSSPDGILEIKKWLNKNKIEDAIFFS